MLLGNSQITTVSLFSFIKKTIFRYDLKNIGLNRSKSCGSPMHFCSNGVSVGLINISCVLVSREALYKILTNISISYVYLGNI